MLTTKDALALRFELMAREHVEAVGRRMRERREELRLTQREVADRLPPPIDGNYISRWERGEHKPEDDTLDAIAAALETTTARLLTDPPDKSVTPDLSNNGRSQLDRIEDALEELRAGLATTQDAVAALEAQTTKELRAIARRLGTSAKGNQSQTGE